MKGDPRWRGAQESEEEIRECLAFAEEHDLLAFERPGRSTGSSGDSAVQTFSFAQRNLCMKSVHFNPQHSTLCILGRPVQVRTVSCRLTSQGSGEPVALGPKNLGDFSVRAAKTPSPSVKEKQKKTGAHPQPREGHPRGVHALLQLQARAVESECILWMFRQGKAALPCEELRLRLVPGFRRPP